MPDAKELLRAIRLNQEVCATYATSITELNRDRSALMTTLRKELEAGATTGDHIVDLMIRHGHELHRETQAQFEKIDSALKGHTGELVLITYACEVTTRHVFMGKNDTETRWFVAIGLLTSDCLRSGYRIELPVSTYVIRYANIAPFVVSKNDVQERNPLDGFSVETPGLAAYANVINESKSDGLMLLIGDSHVMRWFTERFGSKADVFATCAELVGKLVLTPE